MSECGNLCFPGLNLVEPRILHVFISFNFVLKLPTKNTGYLFNIQNYNKSALCKIENNHISYYSQLCAAEVWPSKPIAAVCAKAHSARLLWLQVDGNSC